MRIVGLILKSGNVIDLTSSTKADVVVRVVEWVDYRGVKQSDGIVWREEPKKKFVKYLRFEKDGSTWEFLEDEVAAIKYEGDSEASNSKDTIIL